MKKLFGVSIIFLSLTAMAFAQGAFVDKTTLNMNLRTHRGQAEWRWTPIINFNIGGNVPDGSKVAVEFTNPSGKPFIKLECSSHETGDIQWRGVTDCGNDLESETASTLTGAHTFQIKLGASVLYAGKFTVGKYLFNPANNPAFNKNFYYYVDYDWRLPVAFVGSSKSEYTPRVLTVWVWIKGEVSSPDAKAQLIYQGKVVAETSFGITHHYVPPENNIVTFGRLAFKFNAVLERPEASYNWFRVYENPGEYEVRVTRKGAPARAFKFNIGRDGKPVESGIGKEIKEGYDMTVVPVTIEGTSDGTINQTLLKSGWWGNPISALPQ